MAYKLGETFLAATFSRTESTNRVIPNIWTTKFVRLVFSVIFLSCFFDPAFARGTFICRPENKPLNEQFLFKVTNVLEKKLGDLFSVASTTMLVGDFSITKLETNNVIGSGRAEFRTIDGRDNISSFPRNSNGKEKFWIATFILTNGREYRSFVLNPTNSYYSLNNITYGVAEEFGTCR
jgi:hypothetical protein